MIEVAVSGAGGKLAGAIISAIEEADDLELTALFNPKRDGEGLGGRTIVGDPVAVKADVIVEAAHPDAVFDNLEIWRDTGAAVVVGTSGFTPYRLNLLQSLWGSATPCLVVPNFSIGATLMMRFAAEAARHFEAVEIIERHHATKPDAPSGTALASAMGISEEGGKSSEGSDELVAGARGADVEGVRVHSLRLPGLISQQEVALSNPGEVLSIEHLSTSYDAFASGALRAIRNVRSLEGGVHLGLDHVLG
jgi:4-hydroxy-tetrahydrodipicolinate reductase